MPSLSFGTKLIEEWLGLWSDDAVSEFGPNEAIDGWINGALSGSA